MDDREWQKVATVLDRLIPDMEVTVDPISDALNVKPKGTLREIHLYQGAALDLAGICADVCRAEVEVSEAKRAHNLALRKLRKLTIHRVLLVDTLNIRMARAISGEGGAELDGILKRAGVRGDKQEGNGGA